MPRSPLRAHAAPLLVVLAGWCALPAAPRAQTPAPPAPAAPAPEVAPDSVEFLTSERLRASGLPLSQAVRVGDLLLLSGALGLDPATGALVAGGVEAEARQAMANIFATLEAHGYAGAPLVKCTVLLVDMADWPAFNEVYRSFFDRNFPARSAFGVSGLALGARVEVECIAAVP